MGVVYDLIKDIRIPNMIPVHQTFARPRISDIQGEIRRQIMQKKIISQIKPGMSIAVTAGSRGIHCHMLIIREVVACLKELGAKPFIVSAMGSHGGATAEGQRAILEGYGITQASCGCPVKVSMKVACIGKTEEGHSVYIDEYASKADGIVLVNRIKPHTAFRGPYESGLMKMMAIGLAKQQGANVCHAAGFENMARMVPLFGKAILKYSNILFGLAILENAYDETCELVSLRGDEIEKGEPLLLGRAKAYMPRILVDHIDVLIVAQIGKNFSGDGMDPNISGTFATKCASGGVQTKRVAVLDISEESHGNGVGWGMADVSTQRAYEKFDREMSYPNALTCLVTQVVKVPMIFDNDRQCIQAAIKLCADIDFDRVKIVYIRNTLQLGDIFVSENLREQVKGLENAEITGPSKSLEFDEAGNLKFL